MSLQLINQHVVKPIPLPNIDLRPIKGGEICGNKAYGTILELAKRESGKTSVTFHFLKHCTSPKSHIIIFCSTLYNDDNWIQIRKWLDKRGNPVECFTSTKEDGEDHIQALYEQLTEEAMEREDKQEEPEEINNTEAICDYFAKQTGHKEQKPKKQKKDKYLSPDYVIIFDDISNELRSPYVVKLLKESRHFKARVIISTQYIHDLRPESLKQIGLYLIFKGLPYEKLETLKQLADIDLPMETFWQMYKIATKPTKTETHPFFYVDALKNEFRRNFSKKFILRTEEE